MSDAPHTQALFERLQSGGQSADEARAALFERLYGELRQIAGRLMREERQGHTLRPTGLVHEAYIRLAGQKGLAFENRAHFFGIAARAMRQILVDYAREHTAQKRGGDLKRVTLDEGFEATHAPDYDILDLNEALENLERLDPRASQVVEMRLFGGVSMQGIAHVLGISKRTADGDWSMARMFLTRELSGGR